MSNLSLFDSLPVRKIVKGDTLSPYFTTNGVALFQGVNPDTGTPVPNWNSTYYPAITPHVGSAQSGAFTLINHRWEYNGTDLKFSTTGSGWVTSTVDARFQMNTADGSIRIVGNLASKDNQDVDNLKYYGLAVRGEARFEQEKSVDIFISPLGSSSFGGGVSVVSPVLGTLDDGTNLAETKLASVALYNSNGAVTDFTIKVYKGITSTTPIGTYNQSSILSSFKVTRDMVDGQEVFILEFYVPGVNEAVFRTGFTIMDKDDLYQMEYTETSNTLTDDDGSLTYKGYLYAVKTNKEVAVASGTISAKVVKSLDRSTIKSYSCTYKELKESGITIKQADIAGDNGVPSCSLNVQANLVLQ